jgi:sugar phosphate isomerase/epimerase
MSSVNTYSIFTKPWKNKTADELGKMVMDMGFNGIEYPLRPGYQVDLADARRGLAALGKTLAQYGVSICSVASTTDEPVFEACAEARVPLIRIMYGVDQKKGYMASEADWKKDIERFLPLCRQYKVKVGVQHHYGHMISNTMEMRHLLEDYDPALVGGIFDCAHSGLAGEEPEQALDIIWDHLALVNFKTAYYRLTTGMEAGEASYERYFTMGRYGLCSWRRVVKYMCGRGYEGIACMPAEYTDEANVEAYAPQDLIYLKSLFAEQSK